MLWMDFFTANSGKFLEEDITGIYIMQNTMVRGGGWLAREKK